MVGIRPTQSVINSSLSFFAPLFLRCHFRSFVFQVKYRGNSGYKMSLAVGSEMFALKKAVSLVSGGPAATACCAVDSSKITVC